MDELLTTIAAAELLGIQPAGVQYLCRMGKLPCTKVGVGVRASYYVERADVLAYMAHRPQRGWVKGKPRKVKESES